VLAFLIAFSFNFFLQKYWVFQSAEHHKIPRQMFLQFSVAVMNLGLNTLLLYAFVEYGHLWYILAQLISSAIIACESFVFYRFIFR
jgi:putative flippase GtrA